jgi:hypothetical protein
MTASAPALDRPTSRAHTILIALLLAACILAAHGSALGLGLFMDDHAHWRQLREAGWSLPDLAAACRLELIGGTIDIWWLPDVTLRFFRPVAFGLMKASYTLVDWAAPPMHAFSLAWHWLVCLLLFQLLRNCGASSRGATIVAALFAIHPAHVTTVQWIACQSELMVTTFLLAATLCFGRFRNWPGFAPPSGTRRRWPWAAATIICFLLALGCRENAVMLPFVLLTADLATRRPLRRDAWLLLATLAILLVGYLALRATVLGGTAVPPKPYVIPPTDPTFFRYVFDKTWYYLLGEFLAIPCVPIAGLPFFQARPLVFYALAAIVAATLITLWWRHRTQIPGWLGPAWLLGFMAPLLPVFESPHHLYLPGIGWALIIWQLGHTLWPHTARTWRTLRRTAAITATAALVLYFGLITNWSSLAMRTGHNVEHAVVDEIASRADAIQSGDTIYLANMPMIAHYVRLPLERRLNVHNLRVIPLTWSPRMLGLATPSELVWRDDHTIELHIAGDRYFAGPLGRLVREVHGRPLPDELDATDTYGFRVAVLQRDDEGITVLRYTFDRSLADPRVHLFWGSRVRWAGPVRPPLEH